MGRLPLMRSIIMNVILNVGYERYVVSIEDAAKVMKIVGDAKIAKFEWANEEEGTIDRYVLADHKGVSITPIDRPIEAA